MKKYKFRRIWIIALLLLTSVLVVALYPLPQSAPIRFIDRETGTIKTEKIAGEKWLVWLYNNPAGEATLWTLVKRKLVSSMYGEMMDRRGSVDKIQPFIDEFDIDMSIAQKQQFESFNDFFTRKLIYNARPIDTNSNVIVSPADGKIMAWSDITNADFLIKGYQFNVASFLNDTILAKKYKDGSLMVFRLAPNDYHRFHFPLNGAILGVNLIDGDYYSVNPIALREMVEIFCLNKREYVIISNPLFGDVIMAEVGATMVGSIVQTFKSNMAVKGEEKGYFEFGGSTVVLLFESGRIKIDQDLLKNTANRLETAVTVGEKIGISI